jgi:hypothetical protein
MADGDGRDGPASWRLAVLALVGVGLIAAPFAFDMFERAPKGATMISDFRPYMTAPRLDGFQLDMRQINGGVRQSATRLAEALAGPPAATVRTRFDARFPDFASFDAQWPAIDSSMSEMLAAIKDNLPNYKAVAALPSFTLFPWFFVAPGAILVLLVAAAGRRPTRWKTVRLVVVALGIGLIAAPAVFQMFARAPRGERMVNAFKSIETRERVETIQGYFGDIATGQGAIRLELVPALERSGLSAAQVAARFPAVATLDRRWDPILNDLTPMIGTMSDNVDNYAAVASLPPFALFPWFFVIPGLLVVGLSISTVPWRRSANSAPLTHPEPFQPKGAP